MEATQTATTVLKYGVKTFREAGLEARWGRTRNGAPMIFARDPNAKSNHQRLEWWMVDNVMWNMAKKVGVLDAFTNCTLLGDMFSIPA